MSSILHPYVQCAPSCNPVRPRLQPLTLTLGAPGTACGFVRRASLVITPHPSHAPPESPPLSLPTAHRHGVWTLAETWYAAHRARLPGGAAGRSASDAVRAAAAAAREIGEMAGGTLVRV
jgi:hypothetical protein